jgi:hypothetical protein
VRTTPRPSSASGRRRTWRTGWHTGVPRRRRRRRLKRGEKCVSGKNASVVKYISGKNASMIKMNQW